MRANEPDVATFAGSLGMSVDRVVRGEENELLETLAGFHEGEVDGSNGEGGSGRTLVVSGETLRSGIEWRGSGLRSRGWRYCPGCLREDKESCADQALPAEQRIYFRFWWNVLPIRSCPRHRMVLVDRCRSCGEPIGGRRRRFDACAACGTRLEVSPPDPLPEADTSADRYLLGRMGVLPPTPVAFLDAFALGDASEILWRLGATVVEGDVRKDRSSNADLARIAAAASRGYEICLGGRDGIKAHLDGLLATHASVTGSGPTKAYGSLYLWLDRRRFDAGAVPAHVLCLREIVTEHALDQLPVLDGARLFGRDVATSRYISARSAAIGAGIKPSTFVGRAYAIGVLSETDRTLSRIERSSVAKVLACHDDVMRLGAASRYVGMSQGCFSHLVDRGLVPSAGNIGTNYHLFFRVSDLDSLTARCGLDLPPVARLGPDEVELQDLRILPAKVLVALLEGTITTRGPTRPGVVMSLVVSLADVRTCGAARSGPRRAEVEPVAGSDTEKASIRRQAGRRKGEPTRPSYETLTEGAVVSRLIAARRLRIAARVLQRLIDAGLVDGATRTWDRGGGIPVAAVERFDERYVLSNRLRSEYGVGWGSGHAAHLAAAGMWMRPLGSETAWRCTVLERAEVVRRLPEFHEYERDREEARRRRPR